MAKKAPRNRLVPYAKIGEDAVRRIVQGFACAEPIADIARATGVSAKTCRSIVLALRYRLPGAKAPVVRAYRRLLASKRVAYRRFQQIHAQLRGVQAARDSAALRALPAERQRVLSELRGGALADRLGVTRQTIIAIEQGKYSPTLEMAFQMARVFGVPLEHVFQYPDEP